MRYCDHGHGTTEEVRLLPYDKQGGNMLLCRDHFDAEMKYRQARITTGGEYYKASQILKWDNLKIYEG